MGHSFNNSPLPRPFKDRNTQFISIALCTFSEILILALDEIRALEEEESELFEGPDKPTDLPLATRSVPFCLGMDGGRHHQRRQQKEI